MESSGNYIDSDSEVKKLQELVKKLERQNELLRSKQELGSKSERSEESLSNGDVGKTAAKLNSHHQSAHSTPDVLKHKAEDVGLEDVDVLDVDDLSLKDEEDSWLYSSPKPLTPQQSNVNLYKWVRQDFDHPSPELQSARRSLLSKLDEVARMNRSCSTPALGSPPAKTSSLLSRSTEDSGKYYNHYTENSHHKHSSPSHQRHSMLAATGSRIENGTFTRRKRPEEQNGTMVAGEKEKSEESAYQMREGTDVEKLARQQEESLRQSMATYTSPKRVLRNKSMSIASDTDNSVSPAGSNRSSPGRFDYEGSFFSRHRNSFGSDCSTPPDSPGIFQQQHSTPYADHNPPGARSRLQHPPPSAHSSDSSLEQHQLTDSNDDLHHLAPETRPGSRLQAPGFRSASPAAAAGSGGGAVRGLAVANSQSSLQPPQRGSGLPAPAPRRGIPRPAVSSALRSSLPMPRRSGIPSPRQPTAQERDQSWRDGCF